MKKITKTAPKKPAVKKPAVKKVAVKKVAVKKAAPKKAAAKKKTILTRGEKPVVRIENAKGKARVVILCDHASNTVPAALKDLGVSKKDLQKHVAWDPGTENIGLALTGALNAPAVIAGYSRLVVDLNRGEDSPECIRTVYDHIDVPGTVGLSKADRKQRIDEFFKPYHKAVAAQIDKVLKKKDVPVILSVHSFTPEMDGFKRPWHIGILWNKDDRASVRVIENLRAQNKDLIIGDNEPYSLKDENLGKNTISTHAESKGLPYVIIEFRQDLVNTKAKADKWAKIFLKSLLPVLEDPATYKRRKK